MKRKSKVLTLLLFLTLTLGFTFVAYADTNKCSSCHLYSGYWGFTPVNVQYWSDSSVSMYGYGDGVSNAISGWNSVQYPSPILNSTPNESSANIKFYIAEDKLRSGVGGETFFYKNYGGTWTEISSQVPGTSIDYGIAQVVIDHSNIKDLSYYGSNFRTWLSGHETGHALGLGHFEFSPIHSGNHWMKTCADSTSCTQTSPSSEDKSHLQAKYGPLLP